MFAALCVALSLSAPGAMTSTALPSAPILDTMTTSAMAGGGGSAVAPLNTEHLQSDPNSPDREASFVDRYLSFQLSPLASQQAKDGMLLSHVVGYLLPCGSLWGPVAFTNDAEFSGDVVITWFLSSLLWTVIMSVASTVTVGVGLILFIALPYLSTTATLNEVDRSIKKRGLAKGVDPPKTPTPGQTPATPPGTETPPPSYAY